MPHGWIGTTNENTAAAYKWVNGETFDWTNWGPGEPNNGPNMCVELISSQKFGITYDGAWDDGFCIVPNNFICEISYDKGNISSIFWKWVNILTIYIIYKNQSEQIFLPKVFRSEHLASEFMYFKFLPLGPS